MCKLSIFKISSILEQIEVHVFQFMMMWTASSRYYLVLFLISS